MKKGLICFAALVAAFVFTAVSYADTVSVSSITSDNTGAGAGADIAVSSNGVIYVSVVDNGNVKVLKSSDGGSTFTQLGATIDPQISDPRMTAITLVGLGETPVLAVASNGNGNNVNSDSFVEVYMRDTNAETFLLQGRVSVQLVQGELSDSVNLRAIDLIGAESGVILVTAVSLDTGHPLPNAADSATIKAHSLVLTGANSLDLTLGPADSITLLAGSRSAPDIQAVKSISEGSQKKDTDVAFYVLALVTHDSSVSADGSNDSGVFLIKVYADSNGLRNRTRVKLTNNARFIYDAAMAVEQVSSSDTHDRVTVIISRQTTGVDTLVIFEAGGDSDRAINNMEGDSIVVSDTYTEVDTNLRVTIFTQAPRTLAFSRNSSSLSLAFVSNDNLYKAEGSFSRSAGGGAATSAASVSWSVDTVGTNLDYNNNSVADVGGASDTVTYRFEELAQAVVSSSGYVVGYNDALDRVFYLTIGSSESKKKDSGVCLLDRLFGRTSLKAVFPGLKTFRDTLLGTDLGRKAVGVYYSF